MIVIGLDIGTTSICGVALELTEGRLLKSVTLPNHTGNAAEGQNPDEIIRIVIGIAEELLLHYPEAAGIGVSGQMHGILYTDREGQAVSPLYTWQDRRGLRIGENSEQVADRLSRLSGYRVATGYGLVTDEVLSQDGERPEQAAFLCTIGDYAVMRLTNGNVPRMEASNAGSIGFFDVRSGHFDKEAIQAAGLTSLELLPEVIPSKVQVGRTSGGIPVFVAIGDNQASMLGSVRDLRRGLLLNVGTGAQISAYSDVYAAADGLETRPFPGGGYLLVGASLAGGKSYAMLERFFRSVMTAFSDSEEEVQELYGKMEALLDRNWPSGADLTVRTQFFGTREKPDTRGMIETIGIENWTPEHLTAGFLKGMASELHDFYTLFPEPVRCMISSMTGSGNGIRRNRHLRRICENQFGLPVELPPFREEASVGAALHAAVGLGFVEGYEAAGRLLAQSRP